MSAEVMLDFLEQSNVESRLGFQAASHCGPVLKGVKISNIMTVRAGTWRRLKKALRGSSILCIPLSVYKGREILLLYRYHRLQSHLEKAEVREFLKSCGYKEMSVAAVLMKLRGRYARYQASKREFPHELGIILEYPVKDVKGFIENRGKNFLTEKYWKVYHDKEGALALFARYDEARELAMEEAVAGYPLRLIAVEERKETIK